ncbi:hypothetical protein SAMN07250955_101198 [Arboricoccus pini]|uniref:Uncharacterized protein n=1 Tax=Arboricoccus pini TaxID=1963835 RepID=A0A212PYV2_9PROT|nr:hypothetical protein [Arboricoccus pini]SNB52169.1 hypothetical protein SAMN07250955_101198 [Arboricoccus pini]
MDYRFERLAAGRPLGWKSLFQLLSWRGVLMLALAAALAIAIFVAAASVFLLVLPVLLIVGLVARLFLGGKQKRPRARPASPELIEGQFEVIDSSAKPAAGTGWGPRRP